MLKNAAHALSNLALEPAARDEMVAAGGVKPLVLLLQARRSPLAEP